MRVYRAKSSVLAGTDFKEVRRKAFCLYRHIKCNSKRRPYVRSAYFDREKVFLALFWQHLFDKQKWQDRMRRLRYFAVAIELIRYSRFEPQSKVNPNKLGEVLHRFAGVTREGEMFCVQIKEDKRSGQKFLISVFPEQ